MTHEHIGTFHQGELAKNAEELLAGDLVNNLVVIQVDFHQKQITAHLMSPDGDITRKRYNRNTKVTRSGYYDGI